VLGKWKVSEEDLVKQKITRCIQAIEEFVFVGLEKTMAQVNNLEF
jgi:peptidyl-tRNA hydrolase